MLVPARCAPASPRAVHPPVPPTVPPATSTRAWSMCPPPTLASRSEPTSQPPPQQMISTEVGGRERRNPPNLPPPPPRRGGGRGRTSPVLFAVDFVRRRTPPRSQTANVTPTPPCAVASREARDGEFRFHLEPRRPESFDRCHFPKTDPFGAESSDLCPNGRVSGRQKRSGWHPPGPRVPSPPKIAVGRLARHGECGSSPPEVWGGGHLQSSPCLPHPPPSLAAPRSQWEIAITRGDLRW